MTQHDTPEAVEARAAYLERDPRFTNAAAMLRRLHQRAVEAERERDEDQGVIAVWRGRTERAEAALATARAAILALIGKEARDD